MRWSERNQESIDVEQVAMCALRIMILLPPDEHFRVRYTREFLQARLHVSDGRTTQAVLWLVARGYVDSARGEYWPTRDGHQAYHEACIASVFLTGSSDRKFRDEALSGIVGDGKRSELTNAALPHSNPPYRLPRDPAAIIGTLRRAREIAIELGMSVDEIVAELARGAYSKVRKCRGLTGVEHWGVFTRDKYGWRNLCKRCRADQQRRYRSKMKNKISKLKEK